MTKKTMGKKIWIISLISFICLISINLSGGVLTNMKFGNVTEDGDIVYTAYPFPGYIRDKTSNHMEISENSIAEDGAIYVNWNTSSLLVINPVEDKSFKITDIQLALRHYTSTGNPFTTYTCDINQIELPPEEQTDTNLYLDVNNGTQYATNDNFCNLSSGAAEWDFVTLNSNSFTDLMSHLTIDNGWFAIGGIQGDGGWQSATATVQGYRTNETTTGAVAPQLRVTYIFPINITYPQDKAYNENINTINYTIDSGWTPYGYNYSWYSTDGGITNSSPISLGTNFTSVTSTVGENTWRVWVNDSLDEYYDTVTFTRDSCGTPDSGLWTVNCWDNCTWDYNQNVPGDIHINGTGGELNLNANLHFAGSDQIIWIDSCTLNVNPGGEIS